MAITRERLQETHSLRAPRRRRRMLPVRPVRRRPPLDAPVAGAWAWGLLAAWAVLFSVGVAIEPAPAEPAAPDPLYATVIFTAFFGMLAATVAGLANRRRWGVLASVGAATLLLGMSLACPATGHHALAGWWFGQLGCCLALTAGSLAAWRRA